MPSTNGKRIGLNSHSSPTRTASAATQNTTLRSKCMAPSLRPPSMPGAKRVHMTNPLGEIEGDREQGQDGDDRHGKPRQWHDFEAKPLFGQDQRSQQDLRHGVGFRD